MLTPLPGCQFYLSCWYKRSEFGIRSAIFFSAAALAGSFGGLLAAAITQMDGVGGKPGWAWIFILEGIVTILFGFASFWMVQDFPDEAKFLSPEDRLRVYHRLKADQQASAEHEAFKWSYAWASLKDWKTYMYAMICMGSGGPLYAFSLFLPTSRHPLRIPHDKQTDTFQLSEVWATRPPKLSSSPSVPTFWVQLPPSSSASSEIGLVSAASSP